MSNEAFEQAIPLVYEKIFLKAKAKHPDLTDDELHRKIYDDAFQKAKTDYPGLTDDQLRQKIEANPITEGRRTKVEVSGDDYMPVLLENIKKQARIALLYSTRFIPNGQVTETDPAFIFQLSENQSKQLHHMIGELLSEKKRHPHGLIFAYDGFIERRLKESQFGYYEGIQEIICDQTATLYSKAQNLANRGHGDAADILVELCNNIKENSQNPGKIIALLTTAENAPLLGEHRGIKQIIVNFLLALSGFGLACLAGTKKDRGSFWYKPTTDSQNQLAGFKKKLNEFQQEHEQSDEIQKDDDGLSP